MIGTQFLGRLPLPALFEGRSTHGQPRCQLLAFIHVLAIDLLQGRERAKEQLVVLVGVAEQRIGHHYLMLSILNLIEDVVVED